MTPAQLLTEVLRLRRACIGTPLDAAARSAHERVVAKLRRDAKPSEGRP